jgi:hypothetical protein
MVVAAFVLAIAAVGCGGGDDEASGTDTPSVTVTTDETTTEETGNGTSGGSVGSYCAAVRAVNLAIARAVSVSGQSDAGGSVEVFEENADKVPEELQDDNAVLQEAYGKYAEALADLGLEPGEQLTQEDALKLGAALSHISTQEVREAVTNMSSWAAANCA